MDESNTEKNKIKKEFYLVTYRIGDSVYYMDKWHRIDEVTISGYDIYLKLENITGKIDSTEVQKEPTKYCFYG
jgi:hypothetical protein